MNHNPQHWPGAVGMFLESGTPYFHIRTTRPHGQNGTWSGWATDAQDALNKRERVKAGIIARQTARAEFFEGEISTVTRLTPAQIAAHITGAEWAAILSES